MEKYSFSDVDQTRHQLGATIEMYINGLRHDQCRFCSGWGHSTKMCGTFKLVQKNFGRKGTVYRAIWGEMKSKWLKAYYDKRTHNKVRK